MGIGIVLVDCWFGVIVMLVVRVWLGDVVLVVWEVVSFDDFVDIGAFELLCCHGSLIFDEMLVLLLVGCW